eukprot:COSAG05_NODE_2647_length_2806_cov_3.529368_4_plen_47_part_00
MRAYHVSRARKQPRSDATPHTRPRVDRNSMHRVVDLQPLVKTCSQQ